MKKRIFILLLVFVAVISSVGFSQEGEFEFSDSDDDLSYYFLYLVQKDTALEKMVKKPVIGLGRGIFTFYGEVRDNYTSITAGRLGTRLNISRALNSYLDVDFSLLYGKITGNETKSEPIYNFESSVLCGSASIMYNFEHLLKKIDEKLERDYEKRRVWPYVSIGIESFEFNSKADLMDASGNTYHYWSDGTIRNISENAQTADQSILLNRDYEYETDLREMDEQGLGDYPMIAFAIPLEFGFKANITKRVSMRAGLTYHLCLNDRVDNISSKESSNHSTTRGKDSFLFSFVSLHYSLFSSHTKPPWEVQGDVPDSFFEFKDEDSDGIMDLSDECAFTEPGIKVDVKGCPLDSDRDGIAQHIDDELETAKGNIVDLKGVTMLEDVVSDTLAILHKDLYVWYPSLSSDSELGGSFLVIPPKWLPYDTDGDEYISFDEFNEVIDAWFDFRIEITIEEILELNEFFFSQGGF